MFQLLQKIQRFRIFISYLSIRRLANFSRIILSYLLSFAKLQKFQNHLPYFISIEPANYCNLHCPECPVGNKQISTQEKADFDMSLYVSLIDELKSKLLHVIFYFQGEPFLHPELNKMIQYAHKARLYTTTSTNGQMLTDKTAKEIVLSGLDKLIVSVDGSTQDIYETYRKGGKLSKTIEGIERIVVWKKTLKSATPMIVIQFLVLKTNEHQMKEMKLLAKKLKVDRLTFKTAQLSDFKNGNDLLPTKNKYTRYKIGNDGKYRITKSQPNHCWRLWSGAVVNTKGEILPCCFDKNSEFSFGNIQNNSFSDNWHNKKASDFRRKILQNRKQFEMCRNCTE